MDNMFPNFERPLVIYAHPDDELIGCSALISDMKAKVNIVYATDGMPLQKKTPEYYLPDTAYEFGESYRCLREKEAVSALKELGFTSRERVYFLGLSDGELLENMKELANHVRRLIDKIVPDLVVLGAYEGAHLDHDLLAYAVWQATDGRNITICETPLYSLKGNEILHNSPTSRHDSWTTIPYQLSEEQVARKNRAFGCYASQQIDLQYFDADTTEFYHFIERRRGDIEQFDTPANSGETEYAYTLGHEGFLRAINSLNKH